MRWRKGQRCLRAENATRWRNIFEPTILTGATQQMKVAREETFGPVAPLFRFTTEDEVIAMANDTEFGLAAIFTPKMCAVPGELRKRWNTDGRS